MGNPRPAPPADGERPPRGNRGGRGGRGGRGLQQEALPPAEENLNLNARTTDCCAWIDPRTMSRNMNNPVSRQQGSFPLEDYCGVTNEQGNNPFRGGRGRGRGQCCGGPGSPRDCNRPQDPQGPAATAVELFAKDEQLFLDYFQKAWTVATTNGHDSSTEKVLISLGSEKESVGTAVLTQDSLVVETQSQSTNALNSQAVVFTRTEA